MHQFVDLIASGDGVSIPIMNGMNVNRLISQSKINIDRQRLVYDQQLTLAVVGVRTARPRGHCND